MVVLLVTLGVLLLASGVDLDFSWDSKSHHGLIAVFLVILALEIWWSPKIFRLRPSIPGAALLTTIPGALLAGAILTFALQSAVFDSVSVVGVTIMAYLFVVMSSAVGSSLLGSKSGRSHALLRFLASSLTSGAVAIVLGWIWHLFYDWVSTKGSFVGV